MNLLNLKKTTTLAALLIPGCLSLTCTIAGADPIVGAPTAAPVKQAPQTTPELEAAGAKLETAKQKLDQARAQLGAAKAMLRAAEAEYKACRADRDALALRTEATRLADASGFPSQVSAAEATATRLYPAPQEVPMPTVTPVDLSKTRIQQPDFNAQTDGDGLEAAPTKVNSQGREHFGAPVPVADLKPQRVSSAPAEPNIVP